VPKGKPWTTEEEKQLRVLIAQDKTVNHIASMMNKTHQSIMTKIQRLGLKIEEEGSAKNQIPSSSGLVLPEELPSVEEALKILVAAMNALRQGGLTKTDILRLRAIVETTKIYKDLLAAYVNYRGIEAKIVKMEEDYERLISQTKNLASRADNTKMDQASQQEKGS